MHNIPQFPSARFHSYGASSRQTRRIPSWRSSVYLLPLQSVIITIFEGMNHLQWKAVTVTPSETGISQELWQVSQNGFGSL